MIPIIRSLAELIALTESKVSHESKIKMDNLKNSIIDSGQRKRYIKSIKFNQLDLPNISKQKRRVWRYNKESLSKFLDDLDYNNHTQPSYDITLQERQSNNPQQEAA